MLTEREKEVPQILVDTDHHMSLRSFERDAVRAALEEIDRLRAEIARLRKDGASWKAN